MLVGAKLVTMLSLASAIASWTAGEKGTPAPVLFGCVTKIMRAAEPALTVIVPLLSARYAPLETSNLYVPALFSCVVENVATPLVVATFVVPVIAPGSDSTDTAIGALVEVTVAPLASCSATENAV